MLKVIILSLFIYGCNPNANAQVNDIELESLDDLSILEEFNTDDEGEIQEENNSIAIDGLELDEEFLSADFETIDESPAKSEETIKTARKKENRKTREEKNNFDTNIELDLKLIQNFDKPIEINVEEIVDQSQKNSLRTFTSYELKALKIQLTDIAESPLRVFHIGKGTKLVRIKDNKIVYPPKKLMVRAHTLQDFNQNLYIIDKKGNLLYKVYYQDAANIARVTNLYRPPHRFKRIIKKIKKDKFDKNLNTSFKVNLHTGLNSPNYTKSLLGNPSGFAPLIRTEATVLSNQNFLFDLGLTAMFESISGKFETNGRYNISSFTFGPSFKSKPLIGDFGITIQPRISAFSRISISKNNTSHVVELAETALLLGLENENKYHLYGHFLYGINIQRKWIKTDTKKLFLDVGSDINSDDSIAIYIGHQSDWKW